MTKEEEQQLLVSSIGSVIRKQLETVNIQLRIAKRKELSTKDIPLDWMSNELAGFVIKATEKFIKGQLEHGGDFLVNVRCQDELLQEQFDFFWYSAGAKYQKIKLQEALMNAEIKLKPAPPTPEQELLKRLEDSPRTKTLGSANI